MKKIGLFILFLMGSLGTLHAEVIEAKLFSSPSCPHCRHLKKDGFVQTFNQKHAGVAHITEYNVTEQANNVQFFELLREHNVKSAGIPALFIGDRVLQGYPNPIGTQTEEVLSNLLATGQDSSVLPATQSPTSPVTQPLPRPGSVGTAQAHENLFNQITLWAIIGAGLADGINPCAFAVIVFFVSFLAAYKYTKKEIIVIGSAYCFSVFLAYILMGFGAFHALYAMRSFAYVAVAIQWGTIVLCAVFLVLSLYDFILYQRTRKADKMLLQLSKSSKEYIHKVMRFFLKDKQGSLWRLLLAAFMVGFVVSGVEAVCTGQVYLPTIIVILKEVNRHFWRAGLYLLLYNLMFIAPLVLVFALTLCGKSSATFNTWLKNHVGLCKFILCCVFLGLLILLLTNG